MIDVIVHYSNMMNYVSNEVAPRLVRAKKKWQKEREQEERESKHHVPVEHGNDALTVHGEIIPENDAPTVHGNDVPEEHGKDE